MEVEAMSQRILIVDDDTSVAAGLTALLEDMSWEVRHADTARQAYTEFASWSPDAVMLDVELPDASGIEVLQQLKGYAEATPVIMMSGVGTVDRAVECMKHGAETFLQKPFDSHSLTAALEQAAKAIATQHELAALRREADQQGERFVGISAAARELNRLVEQIAGASSPVLIEGESGSGKGVLARLIHKRSPRSKAPFVDLNCAGLSKELLESELFGHEKGAFTSAISTKPGLFEVAAAGTLFLDEIGEMEISIQARLLKALEDRRFRRVGGVRDLEANFRLVAATNKTLRDEISAGTFRKDLYYRLNVVTIHVPALRERLDDIPLLAQQLAAKLASEIGRKSATISDRAMKKLIEYPWPGNVRELRNVLERAMLVSSASEIRSEDLMLDGSRPGVESTSSTPTQEWEVRPLDDITADYVRAAVKAVGGNMRKASRLLQISPSTLYAKLREGSSETT
jgi:DNA-binding NtrC family response regulator